MLVMLISVLRASSVDQLLLTAIFWGQVICGQESMNEAIMSRALVGEETEKHFLNFWLLSPLFLNTHHPFTPPSIFSSTLPGQGQRNIRLHGGTYFFCMHTIYLLFSFIKPFLQCASYQHYCPWLPEDETKAVWLPWHKGSQVKCWPASQQTRALAVPLQRPLTLGTSVNICELQYPTYFY